MICFFGVLNKINRVIVSGHRNRLDIRIGIKIDLTAVIRVEINLVFMCGIEVTGF